jgi:hypothetical protein
VSDQIDLSLTREGAIVLLNAVDRAAQEAPGEQTRTVLNSIGEVISGRIASNIKVAGKRAKRQ